MVGQLSVVLNASFFRPIADRKEVSGGLRPFLYWFREPVVHFQGEDASVAAVESPNWEQCDQEDMEIIHFCCFFGLVLD